MVLGVIKKPLKTVYHKFGNENNNRGNLGIILNKNKTITKN